MGLMWFHYWPCSLCLSPSLSLARLFLALNTQFHHVKLQNVTDVCFLSRTNLHYPVSDLNLPHLHTTLFFSYIFRPSSCFLFKITSQQSTHVDLRKWLLYNTVKLQRAHSPQRPVPFVFWGVFLQFLTKVYWMTPKFSCCSYSFVKFMAKFHRFQIPSHFMEFGFVVVCDLVNFWRKKQTHIQTSLIKYLFIGLVGTKECVLLWLSPPDIHFLLQTLWMFAHYKNSILCSITRHWSF